MVGHRADFDTANRQEPERLNTGITVVGKRAVVPNGVRLGRNVRVNEGVRAADFGRRRSVASGATIEAQGEGRGRPRRRTVAGAATESAAELPVSAAGGGRR